MKTTFVILLLLLICSQHSTAQEAFKTAVTPDLGIAAGGVAVKNFPAIQTSVRATEKLDLPPLILFMAFWRRGACMKI